MKTIFKIFIFLALPIMSFAQVKEGSVVYSIDFESDDPNMAAMTSMFAGSRLELFFKEEKSRVNMQMGSMITMATVSSADSKKALVMMDVMGQKKASITSVEATDDKATPKLDYEVTDEKKKILGYECTKAIATDEEGNEMIIWFAKEFQVEKSGQKMIAYEVDGLPLEFEVNNQGMMMKFVATDVKTKLENSRELFNMEIPEGYEEVSEEEMKKMGM